MEATFLAKEILANARAHTDGARSFADFHRNAYRLWAVVRFHGLVEQVTRLVYRSEAA